MKFIESEYKRPKYKLTDLEVIKDINRYVAKKHEGHAKLTLCSSKIHSKKDALHFIVDSPNELDVFDLSDISIYIQDKIDFKDIYLDSKVSYSQDVYESSFTDQVEYTPENQNNIEKFIDRNFPLFISYQQQLKEHGMRFSESEKMEMEEAEMLGKDVLDTCRREVESHTLTDEENIASLITKILKLTTERGFDSREIIDKIDTTKLVPSIYK